MTPFWYYTEEGIQTISNFVYFFAMLITEDDEEVSDFVADLFSKSLDAYKIITTCANWEVLEKTIYDMIEANFEGYFDQEFEGSDETSEQQGE